jgi:hypothetical protein
MKRIAILGLLACLSACASPPSTGVSGSGDLVGLVPGRNGAKIELFSGVGPCTQPAMYAHFTGAGMSVGGCWIPINAEHIQVAFFDGTALQIPAASIRSVPSL